MKRVALFLCLVLLLAAFAGCNSITSQAEASKSDTAANTTAEIQTTAAPQTAAEDQTSTNQAAEQPDVVMLEDFTVQTIDGGSFTLSEALKDHELVLVNLFATWCGPCGIEFPFMEEAYKQASDRVAIIALTVEKDDTDDVLQQYVTEKGITFPVGHTEGTNLRSFASDGIPTTIVVDRTGRIVAVEVGSKESVQEFLDLFDGYTGTNYNPNECTYTVCAYDGEYEPVAGVTVNFCTDTTCTPVVTDEEGYAYFKGAPTRYHVQVIGTPEGMQVDGEAEMYTEPYAQVIWVGLKAEGAAE